MKLKILQWSLFLFAVIELCCGADQVHTFLRSSNIIIEGDVNDSGRVFVAATPAENAGRNLGSVCEPNPCGANAFCHVENNQPICSCPLNYDGNPLTACSPNENAGRGPEKCDKSGCGANAECSIVNGVTLCTCPTNYRGDPLVRCVAVKNFCDPNPCGTNAMCQVQNNSPVCICPVNYIGNPLTGCSFPNENAGRAPDKCDKSGCGANAECSIVNGVTLCTCPTNYRGNPLVRCESITNVCDPNPCGANARCYVENNRPNCICPQNYAGNPLSGCSPNGNAAGKPDNACQHSRCGENAACSVINNVPVCTCRENYRGDPLVRCEAEKNHCNPNPCGTNARCHVENGRPICICPVNYVGNPLTACSSNEITVHKAENACELSRCGENAVCNVVNNIALCTCPTNYRGNPLVRCESEKSSVCEPNPCGTNAVCHVENNQPTCSCPVNYVGNPLSHCRLNGETTQRIQSSQPTQPNPTNRAAYRACTMYSNTTTYRVLNGELVKKGEFPWMVALGYLNQNYKVSFDCGGTVISDHFILTAAHCVSDGRPPSIVRLGRLSLLDEDEDGVRTENRYIKEIIKHPDFVRTEKKNDIALIRVNKRIWFSENIKPACLHTELYDANPNVILTVTGWGLVSAEVRNRSNRLHKVDLTTVPLSQCNTIFLDYNQQANQKALRNGISQSQYCAHGSDVNKDSCEGDSGGPLQLLPAGSNTAQVVGIVSFGVACGTKLPGIYTRVAYYVDWIESYVWPDGVIHSVKERLDDS